MVKQTVQQKFWLYCLFLPKSSHINFMRKIKKLKFTLKYDFSFLLKPLMLLSFLSAVTYGLKLLGVLYTDKIFFSAAVIIMIPFLLNRIHTFYNKITVMILLFIFVLLYLYVYDDLMIFLAGKCKNNGVSFGVLNALFSTFGLADFENLIYHTSYGGAKLINGSIVTGAVDIFTVKENCREGAMFLCGKFLLLFSASGISLSIKKRRKEVFFITFFTLLSGNLTVYLLMLLLVFTPYYFIFLLFSFISYFIANTAMIKGGFFANGSLFELALYRDNIVQILAVGVFLCAVAYYFSRLAKERLKW